MSSVAERFRSSLFFVPMLAVLLAIAGATIALSIDSHIDSSDSLPLGLTSTVESARALLSTVAGATITFAAIAFSVSLLIIQQAASQYSPRVVHTLFRDPFNKRVMALVVGTFTYCLLVLRSVRASLDDVGDPLIPNLSVAISVALGIGTILAVVAFINHSAHSMDISKILDQVQREALRNIRRDWSFAPAATPASSSAEPGEDGLCVIRFDRSGWVQFIDADALLELLPDRSTLWVEAYAGRYAIEGTPLGTLSAADSAADLDHVSKAARTAVKVGDTRTMQQDASFGLRQLADVALKALSPGINDPTTAQDAIFHLAAVLAEILRRDPPPARRHGPHGTEVVFTQQPTHDDLVRLGFDEVRGAASGQPTVSIYLLEALSLLTETTAAHHLEHRASSLEVQAGLVLAGSAAADLLPGDHERVRAAYAKRFSPALPA